MNAHQPPGQGGRRWPAPAAAGPVRASVTLPGSKSMTNRALVLAALADGPGTITRPLQARDTLLMARALTALGARIDTGATPGTWQVTPGRPAGDARVDVGNAGTVMRFVPPVAALTAATVEFHGDARASQRPVGAILAALRELGAAIADGGRGAVPFTVRGTGSLAGGVVTLDASASSQLVSGLLLAAPRYGKGAEVRHRGGRAPSAAQILELLTGFGGRCEVTDAGLTVTGTGVIKGVTADLADVNETALVAASLAALADSPSQLTGIGHMRQQETDRLAAIATEINTL